MMADMTNSKDYDLLYALDIVKNNISHFHKHIDTLGLICKEFNDPQVTEDYERVVKALADFEVSVQKGFQSVLHNMESHKEYWAHLRHEMRASIGGIKGYSELILDTFIEYNLKEAQNIIQDILGLVESILQGIDAIRMENALEEPETIEEYTFCYLDESLNQGKIMIVDDSQEKHDLIKRRLHHTPYEIFSCLSGKNALELIPKERPDLIILDLIMPEMNGFEVLNELKMNPITQDIPVLVISSLNEIDTVVQCLRAGAEDYLPMPLNPVILLTRVSSCMHRKHLRDREKHMMKELDESRSQLEKAIQSIDEGFSIFDASEKLMMCNENFFKMYENARKLPDHFTFEELLRFNVSQGVYKKENRQDWNGLECVPPGQEEHWIEKKLLLFRQETSSHLELFSSGKWIEVITNRIQGGGTVCIHKDVTNRIKHEEHMVHQADHDYLTGLANRGYFLKELTKCMEQAEKEDGSFAVMFFDLDGFKNINDTLGHEFGDYVLKSVGENLSHSLRKDDFVARLGGDEFCAIIYGALTLDELRNLANRCLQGIGTKIVRGTTQAHFGVSIGIALYPFHGDTPKNLLEKADQAMYKAKKQGKGRYVIAP
jgi:diguanylate cyclase (GGDEF)-like protein